ncbi:hypothetical protein ACFV2H_52695 [Streptomyces sp. NPDC059629]|uniref:NucA/NucB deoxyribonuclease domain-containing protein n=1 Tax=Streptomyces sp. NPDC059629 TaxID=3346889 RepID=UPI00367F9DF8
MQVRKSRIFAVLLSVATATTIALTGAPGAQADGQAPAHGRLLGSFEPQDQVAHPAALTSPMKASAKDCAPVPVGSAARKAGATTACIQLTGRSDSRNPVASSPLGTAQPAAAACSAAVGTWYYHRHDYCFNNGTANYTAYDEKNPTKVLGTGVLTISSSATLSATSGQWEESETVTLTKVTGAVTALNVGFTANCTASCTAVAPHPWAGSPLLTVGQSVSGTVTYAANPGAGVESKITTSYDMNITQPGATPLNAHSKWSNPRQVRCDTTFASNTSTGCVISDVRAQLILPLSSYGAAAATYGWAEQNLIDHWGSSGNPLQRLADVAAQAANRRNTCEGGATIPFVVSSAVTDDSCDEYPFAGTLQGGKNGGLCANIIPQLENGTWKFYQAPNTPAVTLNEPCVRGHVPSTQNSAAGGKLGSNNQTERVLDTEKFDVVVTS